MENNQSNTKRALFALVVFVLMVSCNSGNEKPNSVEPQTKTAVTQTPTISYDECDTIVSSPNYRYGFTFEREDSINLAVKHIVCMYHGRYDEKTTWNQGNPYYSPNGILTWYAFPRGAMDNPIKLFEIDGVNNRIEAFGKQVGYDQVLKYNREDNLKIYRMYDLSSSMICSPDINDANDVFVIHCYFGYLKQDDRYVFHRSYILDVASRACFSVGEFVCPCYWTNTSGDVVGSGQIYAERGFDGLEYGYIYMDRTNYLGWSTKLQENNPELNKGEFPYDIPNKSWQFGSLDQKYKMPVSMSRGNDRYEFDYANKIITHYENNKRTESLYYDEDLDDPRIWDVEHKGAKVVQYRMDSYGVLSTLVFFSKSGSLYMEIPLNDKGEEIRVTGVYKIANEGRYFDEKIVDVTNDVLGYTKDDSVYSVYEIDALTGTKRKVNTIIGDDNLKYYILEHYLGW